MRPPESAYPATIVGIPPMEDFYIGGAAVKFFRLITENTTLVRAGTA